MLEPFIPNAGIAILFVLFKWAHFENQRWTRARAHGLRGESTAFGTFVDLTGLFATIASWGFLILFAVFVDWKEALGLLVIGVPSLMVLGGLSGLLFGDNLTTWLTGTVAVWIIGSILYYTVFFAH